jgi:hypothetical protein
MQLDIQNFTSAGNNLMYRKDWEDFQHKRCKSKTKVKMENKLHYDRILNALTDNRSIDILNDASLKNVKKMDTREYIIQYIEACNGKKNIKQMTDGIAIALNVSVTDTAEYRKIYDMVVEELNYFQDLQRRFDPKSIDISIDGRTVAIRSLEDGVTASENPFSITGVPSVRVDEETGEQTVTVWEGDNQAPVRAMTYSNSGQVMTEVPAQFSIPTNLPPPMRPVSFNREALPDTMTFATQTEGDYPSSALEMTPANVQKYTTSKKVGGGRLTQTAQTGEEGMIATPMMRNKFPVGGYAEPKQEKIRMNDPRFGTTQSIRIVSPTGQITDYEGADVANAPVRLNSELRSGVRVMSPFNIQSTIMP